jgi:hypothetical protein
MNSPSSIWRKRLTSPLALHYAGFGVMLVLVIGLAIRFSIDWTATSGRSSDALADKQVEIKALDFETASLRGLDSRVEQSRSQIQNFYGRRIPPNYSSIATRIGELALKGPVRVSRIAYSQGPSGTDLTEIVMDAGISGNYPEIMRFVNSLERDPDFFVIRAMALTGQQGGLVNLRLRVSTWLRPADAAASGLPQTTESNEPGGKPSPEKKEVR